MGEDPSRPALMNHLKPLILLHPHGWVNGAITQHAEPPLLFHFFVLIIRRIHQREEHSVEVLQLPTLRACAPYFSFIPCPTNLTLQRQHPTLFISGRQWPPRKGISRPLHHPSPRLSVPPGFSHLLPLSLGRELPAGGRADIVILHCILPQRAEIL